MSFHEHGNKASVSTKTGNFPTSTVTTNCSRKPPWHEIVYYYY